MAQSYFAYPISENIEETPEGFLIAHDCVIARTGWQQYKISELPQEAARDLGVDMSNPHANIDLYRDARDVFNVDTLCSFEGKPVTDTHPPDFVDPTNFNEYARGHIQNVREGYEPLESGEMPVLADLHITAEPLLSKVRNKTVRELSCGYDYAIQKDGDRLIQINITGNHVAVVPKGRAGSEARINDAAPEYTATITAPSTVTKERKPVVNIKQFLLGLGLQAYAKDAEPEKLAEAAAAINSPTTAVPVKPVADTSVGDAQARDKSARMHAALDKMCSGVKCNDADIDELKSLFGEYLTEEEEEPQHIDAAALEDALTATHDGEEGELENKEQGEETDPNGEEHVDDAVNVGDRARVGDSITGARAILTSLRPIVARSKDTAVRSAFNAALASVTRTSKASTGGYGAFGGVASARDKGRNATRTTRPGVRVTDSVDTAPSRDQKLQDFYNVAHKGGK